MGFDNSKLNDMDLEKVSGGLSQEEFEKIYNVTHDCGTIRPGEVATCSCGQTTDLKNAWAGFYSMDRHANAWQCPKCGRINAVWVITMSSEDLERQLENNRKIEESVLKGLN